MNAGWCVRLWEGVGLLAGPQPARPSRPTPRPTPTHACLGGEGFVPGRLKHDLGVQANPVQGRGGRGGGRGGGGSAACVLCGGAMTGVADKPLE